MKNIIKFLLISLLASCGESNAPETEVPGPGASVVIENSPLEEVVWQLSSYKNTNDENISITPSTEFSIGFREYYSNKNVIGYIGCHHLLASYSITGVIISITVEQITTNLCDSASQNLNEFENFYLNSLTSIVSYGIEGNTLTTHSSDSSILVFEKLE